MWLAIAIAAVAGAVLALLLDRLYFRVVAKEDKKAEEAARKVVEEIAKQPLPPKTHEATLAYLNRKPDDGAK